MSNDLRLACFAVLAALALTALPLFLHLPGWVPLLFAFLLGVRALMLWRGHRLPHRLWLFLALIGPVVLLWLSLRTLVGREGGVALLLLLTGFKAFETLSLRDWRVLLALGFFLAATPLLFDQGILSAIWLVGSLFCLTWAMVLLAGGLVAGSVRATTQALLYSAPLMLLFFVAVPRLPGPLWSMPMQDKRATTGMSDSMSPGSIGQMIPSREPAFTAQFLGVQPQTAQLYWRVMAFDRFDGAVWTSGGLQEPVGARPAGVPLRYSVMATPYKGLLPGLANVVAAGEGVQLINGRLLQRLDQDNEAKMRYDAQSVPAQSVAATLNVMERARYLQLSAANPQVQELGRRFASQYAQSSLRLQALQAWLQTQPLRYTLTPPVLQGDVVDGFLFRTRQGFCEHFASAFAVLARAADLPARVVVGFQGGEFNAAGGFWLVRSSDAHAWVEVWLADSAQWVRIDPTALISPQRIERGIANALPQTGERMPVLGGQPPSWWVAAQGQWQRAGFIWQQWVVDYDASRQLSLFQRLGLADVSVKSVVMVLLLGGMVLVLPVFALLLRRRRRFGGAYQRGRWQLSQLLPGLGVAVHPGDTPARLLKKLHRRQGVAVPEIVAALHDWQQWRYVEALAEDDSRWRHWQWRIGRVYWRQRLAAIRHRRR